MVDNSIINSAMTDFSEASDQAKIHATLLLNMISSGHVPTKLQMQKFGEFIVQLQKHYDVIINSAKQILTEDEMPSDPSVGELVSAIENKQKKTFEKEVHDACLLLQRFITVKSYLERYAQELEPYQKEAESLLTEIDNGNLEVINDSPVMERSKAFLDAMDLDSYESEEGLSALEALDSLFPIKVQLGIARKQYFIDGSDKIEIEEDRAIESPMHSSQEKEVVSTSQERIFDETEAVSEALSEAVSETVHDNISFEESGIPSKTSGSFSASNTGKGTLENRSKDATKASHISDDSENENTSGEINKTNSSEEEVMDVASSNIDNADSEAEIFLNSINKIKKATPSASGFKKEISKLPKEAFVLLPLFTNLGALSARQALKFGVAMSCFVDDEVAFDAVKNCLNILCNKSLLSSFDVDGEIVYCLTSYCNGCLRKETIQHSNFFKVSFGKYEIVSDSSIAQSVLRKAVDYNEILLSYFYGIKETLSRDNYQIITGSLTRKNGFYNIAVLFGGKKYLCTVFDNVTDPVDSENLLIVGTSVPGRLSEKYQTVFLYPKLCQKL